MRVAVVHNLPAGGARRRLVNQVAGLDAEIQEICLDTAWPVTETPIRVATTLLADRAPRPLRPPLRYADLVALRRAWRSVGRRIRERRPDVVFLNPCQYLQTPPVSDALDVPSVYFCDEPRRVDSEKAASDSRNPWTRPLYGPLYRAQRRLDRAAVDGVGSIATNSRYTASEIARVYGREAAVVTMGVADSLRHGPRSTPSGSVLSVGTLLPTKGHDIAIEAVALLDPRPRCVVVAPRDDPGERRRLHALAADLRVDLRIRVGISDGDLASAFRDATATVYLARREPLGLASLEAQACGSPVIVADEGGLPETIVPDVTGWAVPRDPRSAADRLRLLLDDGPRRERMSHAARSHAERWSWTASAGEMQALLRRAARR